ncbi:MAG: hypothetical protein ABR554_07885, partial [Pyrinomonadaceae bacterium]
MPRAIAVALLYVTWIGCMTGQVAAHPLGNFSINQFARVEIAVERVRVRYVIDMAEIPTFQERQRSRNEDVYGRELATRIGRGLKLVVAGEQVSLDRLE